MSEAKVYIFESYPDGKVDVYDGRTAEDLSLYDLEVVSEIIKKLMGKCQSQPG